MFHRSERLLLRPGWAEDARELTARIADPAIVRNLSRVPWPYTVENAAEWLALPKEAKLPNFLLTLPGRTGSPIIGACGIHEGESGETEMGYWIAKDWWGQGFATEAARAVIDYAFEEFEATELRAGARVVNSASRRVLEKCGFQWTNVELLRVLSLGCSVPTDRFRLDRGLWSSLKSWRNAVRQ